jgi:hypothetical protein
MLPSAIDALLGWKWSTEAYASGEEAVQLYGNIVTLSQRKRLRSFGGVV